MEFLGEKITTSQQVVVLQCLINNETDYNNEGEAHKTFWNKLKG